MSHFQTCSDKNENNIADCNDRPNCVMKAVNTYNECMSGASDENVAAIAIKSQEKANTKNRQTEAGFANAALLVDFPLMVYQLSGSTHNSWLVHADDFK